MEAISHPEARRVKLAILVRFAPDRRSRALRCKLRIRGITIGLLAAALIFGASLNAQSPKYGIGRAASEEEIRAWDISIPPDGTGLPAGKGTAVEGKEVYKLRCAECHGDNAEGGDAEALVGGRETLRSPKPLKTVGSYWPYATTLWDYVNRAMPFDRPGMLTNDQVYAVVAHVLFLNDIIEEKTEMNAESLPQVKMPNRDAFVPASEVDAEVEPSRPGGSKE